MTCVAWNYIIELRYLLKELHKKAADKWENLGIFLAIDPGELNTIKANDADCHNCLREMLKVWLKKPEPSWSNIIDALNDLGDEQLAKELKQKYIDCAWLV